MGLRDKIKGALHPDRERDDGYKDSHATQPDTKYSSNTAATTTTTEAGEYQADPYRDNKYDTSHTSSGAATGYGHRKADSGVDFGDQPYIKDDDVTRTSNTKGEYWGNLNQGRYSPTRKTDALNTNDDQNRLQHKDLPLRPDEQVSSTSGYDNTRYDTRGTTTGATGATGGTYNTVAGAGSREYDSRLYDRDTNMGHDLGRDNKTALGTAGQTWDRDTDYNADYNTNKYQPGGGVPQSTMLDPYQTAPANNRAGTLDSDYSSKNSDRDASRLPGGGSDQFAATSGVANTHGMGPGHFGPGHEGAKVVHKCVGCGMDNDISQYFRKDVTYRMG